MYANKKSKWATLIAFLILIASNASFAVGFGKINVYSYLNELLSAEIELIGVENINTDLLIANLASSKDFIRAKMARPFFLTKLSFEIVRHEEKTVIYVASTKPVKHPFLDFLVELSWPDGKLVKGYTILIDPPPLGKALVNRPKSLANKRSLITNNTKVELAKTITLSSEPLASITKPDNSKQNINQEHPSIAATDELTSTKPAVTTKKAASESLSSATSKQATDELLSPATNMPTASEPMLATGGAENSPQVGHVIATQPLHAQIKANNNNNEENLSIDETELESALGDDIEVNKSKQATGLLKGIILTLKENPLFTNFKVDSNKLNNKPSVPAKTTAKTGDLTSLEDLLAQSKQQENSPNKKAAMYADENTVADLVETDNNALANKINTSATKTSNNLNQRAVHQQNLQLKQKRNNNSTYRNYGMQLILSFLMVLISGVFIIKILRRSNAIAVNEDKEELAMAAAVKEQDLLTQSIDENYIANMERAVMGSENYMEDDLTSIELEEDDEILGLAEDDTIEFAEEPTDDLAEIEAAIANITTEEYYSSKQQADDIDTEQETLASIDDINTEQETLASIDDVDIEQETLASIDDINTEQETLASIDDVGTEQETLANIDDIDTEQTALMDIDFAGEILELSDNYPDYKELALEDGGLEGSLPDELQESFDLLTDNKDEIELKINLARQYIEAGDSITAKNTLNEIINIAGTTQKVTIERLLQELATSNTE